MDCCLPRPTLASCQVLQTIQNGQNRSSSTSLLISSVAPSLLQVTYWPDRCDQVMVWWLTSHVATNTNQPCQTGTWHAGATLHTIISQYFKVSHGWVSLNWGAKSTIEKKTQLALRTKKLGWSNIFNFYIHQNDMSSRGQANMQKQAQHCSVKKKTQWGGKTYLWGIFFRISREYVKCRRGSLGVA